GLVLADSRRRARDQASLGHCRMRCVRQRHRSRSDDEATASRRADQCRAQRRALSALQRQRPPAHHGARSTAVALGGYPALRNSITLLSPLQKRDHVSISTRRFSSIVPRAYARSTLLPAVRLDMAVLTSRALMISDSASFVSSSVSCDNPCSTALL